MTTRKKSTTTTLRTKECIYRLLCDSLEYWNSLRARKNDLRSGENDLVLVGKFGGWISRISARLDLSSKLGGILSMAALILEVQPLAPIVSIVLSLKLAVTGENDMSLVLAFSRIALWRSGYPNS